MDVISILQSKNRCLRRLLELSTRFVAALDSGKCDELRLFHAKRDRHFKAFALYDRRVGAEIAALPSGQRTPALIERVRACLAEQNRLTQEIIQADNRIMTRLQEEKARVQRELASARKSQCVVGKFKSSWVPGCGEELDRKL